VDLDESDPNSRGDYEHPLYRLGILKGTGFYATTGLPDFVKLLNGPPLLVIPHYAQNVLRGLDRLVGEQTPLQGLLTIGRVALPDQDGIDNDGFPLGSGVDDADLAARPKLCLRSSLRAGGAPSG
jgi:hypothetical protein